MSGAMALRRTRTASRTALRQIRWIRRYAAAERPFRFVDVLLYLGPYAHNARLDAVHEIFKTHRQGGRLKANRRVVPVVQASRRRNMRSRHPDGCSCPKNSDRKDRASENRAPHPATATLIGHEMSPAMAKFGKPSTVRRASNL